LPDTFSSTSPRNGTAFAGARACDKPARVPDAGIRGIRARENKDRLVVLPRPSRLKPGDQVRVVSGLLQGQIGTLAGLNSHERVTVLLRTLGRTILRVEDIEAVR
jgi:transcription antitermination factor NusG